MRRLKPAKKKTGPTDVYSKEMIDRVFRLALLGLKNDEMAECLNITPALFNKWTQDPKCHAFRTAVEKGRTEADSKVAEALYHRATGYSHNDVHIMANRVKIYDEDGKVIEERTEPLIVPIVKHYPPDSYAAQKWLAIRQRKNWTETQKIEHQFSGSFEIEHVQAHLSNEEEYSMPELKELLKQSITQHEHDILPSSDN